MDYEAWIRAIVFDDTNMSDKDNRYFLKDYCVNEFCIALLHQLSLVYVHRLDFRNIVEGIFYKIRDAFIRDFTSHEDRNKITEAFERYLEDCETNGKPIIDNKFTEEFRNAFAGYARAHSLDIWHCNIEQILAITRKLQITLIYMIAGDNFDWQIFPYGKPICVIFKEVNGRFSSINSKHLTNPKNPENLEDPKNHFWPVSWNPSLPNNISFFQETISKVIKFRNTNQKIQYKIFDLLRQYPWHFSLFKPYFEFLVESAGYSIYIMQREAIDLVKKFCSTCFRHIPIDENCLNCLLKQGKISELRAQYCKTCTKQISSSHFIVYDLAIFHHTCFNL